MAEKERYDVMFEGDIEMLRKTCELHAMKVIGIVVETEKLVEKELEPKRFGVAEEDFLFNLLSSEFSGKIVSVEKRTT